MKNIVLLITDTFRYDNLFERAVRPVRTPCLDAFARERATEINGFYNSSFPTIPHRTDVIAGTVGWPRYGWQDLAGSAERVVPQILAEHGYASQLICDCPHLFNSGFQKTFTAAFQHRGQEGDKSLLHLNDPVQSVVPPEKTRSAQFFQGHPVVDSHRWFNRYYTCEGDTFSHKTSTTTARWLEENYQAGPFFLWVDFFDPHEPWDPPEYLVKRYQKEYAGIPMLHPNYGRSDVYTDEELTNLWAHYAAEAEMVDRALGRIIQKVDDLQLWDDTVVIVTSDHGFSIGEHERCGKSNISDDDDRMWPIYPEVGHVPFLAAGVDIPAGEERRAFAQPMDIAPTLFELAGIPESAAAGMEGKSFADLLRGKTATHRSAVLSSSHMGVSPKEIGSRATTPFLVTESFGYAPVGPDGKKELYDLAADPLATINIAADNPSVVREMESVFIAYLQDLKGTGDLVKFWQKQFGADA